MHAGQAHYQVRYIPRSLISISLAFTQKCSVWAQAHLLSHISICASQDTVHPAMYLKPFVACVGAGFISVMSSCLDLFSNTCLSAATGSLGYEEECTVFSRLVSTQKYSGNNCR